MVEYPYMLGVVICLQNQGSAWLHSQAWQPPHAELQPQIRREVEAKTWVSPSLCCWRTSSWERADRSDPHCPGPGVQQPPEVLQAALASDLELAVEEIEALWSASGLFSTLRLRTLWLAGSVACPLPPAQSHRTELISWFSFLGSLLGTFGM